jgi:hypothetical protein
MYFAIGIFTEKFPFSVQRLPNPTKSLQVPQRLILDTSLFLQGMFPTGRLIGIDQAFPTK